ncbi:MAG TPA: hypothetical protein EYG92_05865 [Lutibacter sp.]|nr:hypothetical protein [Lutibacter sp.]
MDVKKLKTSIEVLKNDLDGALLACDIWITGTSQSIAGFNTNPVAVALFERTTEFMDKALKDSGFPTLENYYILNLANNATVLVLHFEGYQWGMLVDSSKVQLGLLLNIAIPNARKAFEEAVNS